MSYDDNCQNCPYCRQDHLVGTEHFSERENPPITLEDNSSTVLLVFQSPGDKEWLVGKAIQPTKKQGGTAGVRIQNSWGRKNKSRTDFDIVNAVQCFPGNEGDRDFDPNVMAICSCANRLRGILESKEYEEIIAFGEVAKQVVECLVKKLNFTPKVVPATHPNGGVKNADLDALW